MNKKVLSDLLRICRPFSSSKAETFDTVHRVLLHKFFNMPCVLPPELAEETQKILTPLPIQPEGTPHAFTPEILGLLREQSTCLRKKQGAFYTPFPLADLLARETLFSFIQTVLNIPFSSVETLSDTQKKQLKVLLKNITVCDPAAGTGGLLIPFALQLADLRGQLSPRTSKNVLLGEILQHNLYAADISQNALTDFQYRADLLTGRKNIPLHTLCEDALTIQNNRTVWEEKFPAVFEKGGFDIVLSNPPYVGQKNNKEIFTALRQNPVWKNYITPKSDLIYLFFFLTLRILRPDGVAGFLTTPYFSTSAGGRFLRQHLKNESTFLRLINFENQKLFPDTAQHTLLSVFKKGKTKTSCLVGLPATPLAQDALFTTESHYLTTRSENEQPFVSAVLRKIEQNAACPLGEIASISNGLMTGCDKISAAHIRQHHLPASYKGRGVFVLTNEEARKLPLSAKEKRRLKPFFKNSDIFPYVPNTEPKYRLIDFFYPNDRNTDFSVYPHLRAHLAQFKKVLLARRQNNNGIQHQLQKGNYWFGSVRRKMDFEGEKLVIPHRAGRNIFAYCPKAWYASSDVYFISSPKKNFSLLFLLGLLNTKLYYLWLFYKGKRKGNLLELYSEPLKNLPIPVCTKKQKRQMETLAKKIFFAKKQHQNSTDLEQQADSLAAALFGLNAKEEKQLIRWCP